MSLIPVDYPTYSNSISGLSDYTTIPDADFTGINFFNCINQIKYLLLNEATGSTSNFMRASGSQIIIGTKQFGSVVVNANTTDNGYLTLGGGLIVFDNSGNVSINNINISNSKLQNLQYLDVSSSLNTRLTNDENNITNLLNNAITISGIKTFSSSPIVPTPSSNSNNTQAASTAYVDSAISALVAGAPSTLSTLNEIAASLNDNTNLATTLTNSIALKAPINNPTFTGTVVIPTMTFNGSDLQTRLSTDESNIATNTSNITSLQSSKQNVLTSSTALLGSTLNNASLTNIGNLQYLDISSSLTTQLSNKQATITSSTNLSINNLTCAGSLSFPSNSISTSAINGYSAPSTLLSSANTWSAAQTFSSISCTSETDTGLLTAYEISEKLNSVSGSSSFTLNYASGSVFYISGTQPSSNFTVSITNIPTTTTNQYTITLIYNSSTACYCNSISATNTSSASIYSGVPKYIGGAAPIFSGSYTVFIQSFTVLQCFSSAYIITNCIGFN